MSISNNFQKMEFYSVPGNGKMKMADLLAKLSNDNKTTVAFDEAAKKAVFDGLANGQFSTIIIDEFDDGYREIIAHK